jgi:hypothetical protein
LVEVDEDERCQDEQTANAVAPEGCGCAWNKIIFFLIFPSLKCIAKSILTKVGDEDAADDGAAAASQAVMNALEDALSGAAQVLRRVVGDVRAARRPNCRVRDSFKEKNL